MREAAAEAGVLLRFRYDAASGKPREIPASLTEHLRLIADLLVLAFQADVTRVATFVIANEGSNRPYPFIGVREGHHDLSHHESKEEKRNKLKQIDLFHTKQLAYILGKMDGIKEAGGSIARLATECEVVIEALAD